jgi:hypothetical protein
MKIVCDFCRGRGWNPPLRPDAHPGACSFCKGAGFATLAAVCKRIDERPGTVVKLIRFRYMPRRGPHQKVALRIFYKLAALAWPKERDLFDETMRLAQ